jgi:5-methylcytosine-specific restriction endonuclease McrA
MYQLTLQDIESGEQQYENGSDELYKNEAWLRDQYHAQNKTISEIAETADACHGTVQYWLRKHYIITANEQLKSLPDVELLKDRSLLRQKYIEESLTTHEIGEVVGLSHSVVRRALRAHKIEVRSMSDGAIAAMEDSYDDLHDEEWLREQYVDLGKSGHQISREVGCCNHTVYRWLDKHDIETRNTGQPSGDDHPDYSGGPFPYGKGWTAKKRREVRSRDGDKCVRCGMSREEHQNEYDQNLHVHHVTPARQFDDAEKRNAMDNLITLCKTCHDTVEEFAKSGLSIDFKSG